MDTVKAFVKETFDRETLKTGTRIIALGVVYAAALTVTFGVFGAMFGGKEA